VRELIEAAQALGACIGKGPLGDGTCKKRDGDDVTSRPPFLKMRKSGMFEASLRNGTIAP